MTTTDNNSVAAAAPIFYDRIYDDAVKLTIEVRDYFADRAETDRIFLTQGQKLAMMRESMRVTTRLAQAVAWIMAQRAVHEGEISAEDARTSTYRLENHRVCLAEDDGRLAGLPAEFKVLWWRSQRLYQRVARLEDLAQRRAGYGQAIH